jgi:hypothetical protein
MTKDMGCVRVLMTAPLALVIDDALWNSNHHRISLTAVGRGRKRHSKDHADAGPGGAPDTPLMPADGIHPRFMQPRERLRECFSAP